MELLVRRVDRAGTNVPQNENPRREATMRFMIIVKAMRQLFELDDFGPSQAVERFRKMDMA